ncbi:hypothetical protein L1887_23948 [Cichorium endivia]|nr:hypothetical protein L1887_23948 [Cichorium endivia]
MVKPTEVTSGNLENLCQMIQEGLFDIPSHPRGIFGDLEVCIRGDDSITSEDALTTEISLSNEMMISIGRWLGNEDRIRTLIDNVGSNGMALLTSNYLNSWLVMLPRGEDFSLADVFGLIEQNRNGLWIAEYSISQSTLETIFSHFAANSS